MLPVRTDRPAVPWLPAQRRANSMRMQPTSASVSRGRPRPGSLRLVPQPPEVRPASSSVRVHAGQPTSRLSPRAGRQRLLLQHRRVDTTLKHSAVRSEVVSIRGSPPASAGRAAGPQGPGTPLSGGGAAVQHVGHLVELVPVHVDPAQLLPGHATRAGGAAAACPRVPLEFLVHLTPGRGKSFWQSPGTLRTVPLGVSSTPAAVSYRAPRPEAGRRRSLSHGRETRRRRRCPMPTPTHHAARPG